jgi:hypothetical protein
MVESFGISAGGRSAEGLFRAATGAVSASAASVGDAVLEGHPIEVKRATSNTLNQVRAVKYIVLVAYYEPTGSWFVIPAHVVVAEASRKGRGQHTENPFESCTLSLARLGEYRVDDPAQLRERTLTAIAESDRYGELRDEMCRVLEQSHELAVECIDRVQAALKRLNIGVDPPRRRSAK